MSTSTHGSTVLLTGSAGKIGRYVIKKMIADGHRVVATDVQPSIGRKKSYSKSKRFTYIPCDLVDSNAVQRLVRQANPDVVIHAAAIVAPIAYAIPDMAKAVNVDGSKNLLNAITQHDTAVHFIFCSSYTVHGPISPIQSDITWSSETAVNPADNYGRHKVEIEEFIQSQSNPWTILRIGGVFDADSLVPKHPSYQPFAFMVPLDQKEHGADVLDVATALSESVKVRPKNRILMIGGDSTWKMTARQFRKGVFSSMGLSLPNEQAFRIPPSYNDDQGWYYENWMDTQESQSLLNFQQHSFENFIARLKKKYFLFRLLGPCINGLIQRKLAKASPYIGNNSIKSGLFLEDDVRSVFS